MNNTSLKDRFSQILKRPKRVKAAPPEYSDQKTQEFFCEAQVGNLKSVRRLAADPEVDLNWRNYYGHSAFYIACRYQRMAVVKFFLGLEDGLMDYNLSDDCARTPFMCVAALGHSQAVEVLLADPRIDVNRPDDQGITPIWQASAMAHLHIVRMVLASKREIDVRRKAGKMMRTAAEAVRERSLRTQKLSYETEEHFQETRESYSRIADLLEGFEEEPAVVRGSLRNEMGLDEPDIGRLFALVVYVTDGYLAFKAPSSPTQRFFQIASALPMDLQMVLCHRVFGSTRCNVKTRHSEPGFKEFVRD